MLVSESYISKVGRCTLVSSLAKPEILLRQSTYIEFFVLNLNQFKYIKDIKYKVTFSARRLSNVTKLLCLRNSMKSCFKFEKQYVLKAVFEKSFPKITLLLCYTLFRGNTAIGKVFQVCFANFYRVAFLRNAAHTTTTETRRSATSVRFSRSGFRCAACDRRADLNVRDLPLRCTSSCTWKSSQ